MCGTFPGQDESHPGEGEHKRVTPSRRPAKEMRKQPRGIQPRSENSEVVVFRAQPPHYFFAGEFASQLVTSHYWVTYRAMPLVMIRKGNQRNSSMLLT